MAQLSSEMNLEDSPHAEQKNKVKGLWEHHNVLSIEISRSGEAMLVF